MKFHQFWLPPVKICLATSGKIHYWPDPWKKSFWCPYAFTQEEHSCKIWLQKDQARKKFVCLIKQLPGPNIFG